MNAPAGMLYCDCGCRRQDYFNRLRLIEIEQAVDGENLRQIKFVKRFHVTRECYEPFIEELQAMKLLNDITMRYRHAPWWRRLGRARTILKLQYIINIRNKGIEDTRRRSIRSAIMFASPQRVAGWFDWYWRKQNERRKQREQPKFEIAK